MSGFDDYIPVSVPFSPSLLSGIALWLEGADFKNDPPSAQWTDRSGNGNHAVPSGFKYTNLCGNDGQGGIAFDGSCDFTIAHSNTYKTQDLSIEMLLKPNGLPANGVRLLFCHTPDTAQGYTVEYHPQNRTSFYFAQYYGTFYITPAIILNHGAVNHLVITKNGVSVKVYVNGSQVISENTPNGVTIYGTNSLIIGGTFGGTDRFTGTMYAVRIYNRPLQDGEVELLHKYCTQGV